MAEEMSPQARVQSIVKKSVTAVSLLRDPKSDQWCIYELARCSIAAVALEDRALYEAGIRLLHKSLEDTLNERPLKATM